MLAFREDQVVPANDLRDGSAVGSKNRYPHAHRLDENMSKLLSPAGCTARGEYQHRDSTKDLRDLLVTDCGHPFDGGCGAGVVCEPPPVCFLGSRSTDD